MVGAFFVPLKKREHFSEHFVVLQTTEA
jgi:hypothetical protein